MAELEQRPVVLVIEDLHWADDATLKLLTHVLGVVAVHGTTGPTPALVVLTSRSREEGNPVGLALSRLEREACYRELSLPAMSGLEVSELVTRVRDTPPEPRLLTELMEATDGTPLLVRSVVQRLTQTGSLVVGTGGRLTAKGELLSRRAADIDSEVVARLEFISGSCEQMLSVAAFLGARGSLAELEAVVGYDADDLDRSLDEASEAGLLEDDGVAYWFGHSELPRALSRRPNRTRRQRMHATIADRLEQLYGHASTSHARDIARHLCLSGSSASRERVRHYASIAADQSFGDGAWADAARYYDAILDAEDSVTSRTDDLLLRAGIAHFRNHDHEVAQERLRRAVDLCRDLKETRLWGIAAITLTKSLTISGSVREIDQHPLEEFLAETEDEVGLHARALAQLADSRFAGADIDAGMRLARRALDAAKDAKDDQVRCEVELALGVQHLVRLELPEAKACFRRCRESAELLGDPWVLRWGDTRLPLALWTEGRLQESDKLAEQAVMSAESCFDSAEASLALASRTGVAVDRGRFNEAERFGALAYQHFLRSDYFYAMIIVAPALVACRAYQGNSAAAEAAISRAASTGIDVRRYQLALLALSGRKPDLRAALEKAPLHIRKARALNAFDLAFSALEVEIGDAADDPVMMAGTIDGLQRADASGVMFTIGWAASVPRLLGVASFRVGRHDSAEAWLRQAIAATEGAGAFGEAARARLDLARVLLENGSQEDRHRAVAELDMAITAFRRMGMAAFLPIAEQLRRQSP
jgi:tetratricopeptide (TPR) repeat protein